MNGVRSTYMRRGWLLTALAAAVLLAASPGTAEAQNTGVTITGPSNNTVNEGGTATYTVAIDGFIAAAVDADDPKDGIQADEHVAPVAITVTLTDPIGPDSDTAATEGEPTDVSLNEGNTVTFNIPGNSRTTAVRFRDSMDIRVRTNPDKDAEDEKFSPEFALSDAGGLTTTAGGSTPIALATAGTPANPNSLTIDDVQTQSYVLTLDSRQPTEGTPVDVILRASPPHDDGSVSLTLNLNKPAPDWSLTVEGTAATTARLDSTTAADTTPGQAIQILNPREDRNRVSDTVTLTAHSGVAGDAKLEDSLTVTLADMHALPAVTAKVVDMDGEVLDPQPTSVEEGESVKIAVMPVDKDGKVTTANEDLKIQLMASGNADARDYRLGGAISITSGRNASTPVDLTAEMDEDVGMEMLVLDATVSGEAVNGTETSMSAGVLSINIEDATQKSITPMTQEEAYPKIEAAIKVGAGDDEMLNPGESFELKTADLFTVMTGYTASYGASVEGDAISASASGDMVMVNAVKAGVSKLTVTGTAKAAGASFGSTQEVSNVADVFFEVTVVDKELMITLEMPDNVMDGNIVEGMSYDIGVMANREITEAEGSVEVTFMQRAGAERAASDADYSISSVTIMAGYDSGTAELMVTEDMTDDAGHADGESLDLYGSFGDDGMTNVLEFTIWDEAVPALPLIGQLVLALFLTLGGARLYRRRQG